MRRYHVAIVGSGPSGFFAAASLLKFADANDVDMHIDMLEMLPTPWGLVRSGVAPDHPKIKSISAQFERTAADPRLRFFGNVNVGEHVLPAELAERYHAVIYAIGAQSDRSLGIPGEDLPGSVSAVDFVGWYNAHPHHRDMAPDISTGRAVVIGNGNVALDVARILVTDPDALAATDIADHALESLHDRGVEEVLVVGRRGPLQAPFTTLELRELGHLEGLADVDIVVDPADFADITEADLEAAGKTVRNNIKVLRGFAETTPKNAKRRIVFRFRTSPIEIKGNGRVESIVLGRNELVEENGRVVARDTGEREEIPAQLVVRAVGYRGVPTPGLPFDERSGTIPHTAGRIEGRRHEYVVGWIKRGPTGVIGSNKSDSQETVDTLVADLQAAEPSDFGADHADELARWLLERQPRVVTHDHWRRIDAHERSLGEPHGRPRVKLASIEEMLRISHG
ncbi:NADPH-dependent glutamate synthase subunit beta-like oxidoreductase [Mycolicibacterium phlei]|uniref:ferredoxin--NADP(+) reductase n=1 Tax=Mycolicibacterium phlei DSM 43239 = CCUG 21000 TaxID=1226750 RepID=A0A5N5V381_MYCPH|nr:FAD-dependent oxidoreductase [Mycolicibacterium phlei]VEG08713.1 NADPH-dependent glutamate synthase subunit beta-like oxidoreductase [Mycobacteroides chelonae]AMO60594.1 NADPH-ferredoxin reductase FprA [Mycolicibacterium phlei]EID13293.1 NADPH-dependent glutamate synthase subunit beta-like oxidoreductase [Mycolicibacterium phlei RIVM601174]KAB7756384.1 NADP oxidoreductase [Mycolicibacterium phlei DSM 43239 = CCUG 21000]KXW63270.1 NADP oxidoreductase [Mycolicibacterium phlei DSM 43239 = CCUG